MSRSNFYSILRIIEPEIVKQNTRFREAVPAKIRLLITLRYLATGDSFSSLMYLFKVSKPFDYVAHGFESYCKCSTE